MSNIALLVQSTTAALPVSIGGNIIFDTVVYSTGNISYNSVTGVVTFNESGRYSINWSIATQASLAASGAVFAIDTSTGDHIVGASPIKTGEVSGMAIIDVSEAPVTASLVNDSTASFYLAGMTPIKATMTIIQDDDVLPVTMECYAVAQLAYILSQMITAYAETTWTVYNQSLYSFSGTPLDLYTAPGAEGPGFLRLTDAEDGIEVLPLGEINLVYPGDGTVYDPSFTYLPTPSPLPQNCEANLLAAVLAYLPVDTSTVIYMGPSLSTSGIVYQNAFGVLVLSDGEGNTPVFVASKNIQRIYTTPVAKKAAAEEAKIPSVTILKQ